ncbi:MAG TPA: hypothetical protein VFH45_10060 [Acidimicrobiales bacterium]|nr:hypothetical protein [Acidimicrobiales bacterium]
MGVAVEIRGATYPVGADVPLVFGRAAAAGVIGLDPADLGISATAGSVEFGAGVWWVVNRSTKRRLHLIVGPGGGEVILDCGAKYAVNVSPLTVLVPGAISTHRLDVTVPEAELARLDRLPVSSETMTVERVRLSDKDRAVLAALFGGYLETFPRRSTRPRTYQQAAEVLGDPWTKLTVRKQVERVKERLARSGVYFEGAQAAYDLADYLITAGLLTPDDLQRVGGRG